MLGEFWYSGIEVCTMLGEVWYNGVEVCTMLGSFGTMVWRLVPCRGVLVPC